MSENRKTSVKTLIQGAIFLAAITPIFYLIILQSPEFRAISAKHVPKENTTPSLPTPANGVMHTYTQATPVAPFKIEANDQDHYFLRMVDAHTLEPVMDIFLSRGSNVMLDVPPGTYRIRYACGKSWYGEPELFGKETNYGEFDADLNFQAFGGQAIGHTLTIKKVLNGNLTASNIRPENF